MTPIIAILEAYRTLFCNLLLAWYSQLSVGEKLTYFYLLPTVVFGIYLFETIRYHLKNITLDRGKGSIIALGRISLTGDIGKTFTQDSVALAFRNEFSRIRRSLDEMANNRETSYHAPSTGMDTGYCHIGLRQKAPVPRIRTIKDQTFEKQITLKFGTVTIPVSDIINMLIAFAGILPVVTRRRYKDSLIHVNVIQAGNITTVSVFKPRGQKKGKQWQFATLTKTVRTQDLEGINNLLRSAAFMILELNNSFTNKAWEGMQFLLDGFSAFSEYRKTGRSEIRDVARENFKKAVQKDPEHNNEALYYYGVMKMMDRTNEAIEEAKGYFKTALSTSNKRLCAFVHCGLVFCYAQTYHRLGYRSGRTIAKAEAHFNEALATWKDLEGVQESIPLHPLFLYTKALIIMINDTPERIAQFYQAVSVSLKAIECAPQNSMFCNNLGWVFLRMFEWGVCKIPKKERDNIPLKLDRVMSIPKLAEKYFYRSLALNAANSLTHANLCRLFSTGYYVKHDVEGVHYRNCHYHGLKAVTINPEYINGYRDLALAHIRYGKMEKAYFYYEKALELAECPYKDQEIINRCVEAVQNQTNHGTIPASELQRWKNPKETLIEPRAIYKTENDGVNDNEKRG